MSLLGIQNFLNFKLLLTLNLNWSYRFSLTSWDLGLMIRFKQGDMENVVDLELGRKFQPASYKTDEFRDLERSEALVVQLGTQVSGGNVSPE
jgi:hypothetical protein